MAKIPGTTKRRKNEILVGLPVIDDDWDQETKNAHALRNQTWVDGECPHCGDARKLTAFVALGLVSVTFQHDDDCPLSELLDPQEP